MIEPVSGHALSDVVEQRGEQQQVRTVHAANERCGTSNRFREVPIDVPTVVRIALRTALSACPLGDQLHPQVIAIERFDDIDAPRSGGEQPHEQPAGICGPRVRQRRGPMQRRQRGARNRQSSFRR